ncbi:MAG: hypothetical protein JXA73_20190 [Acidobacteria bacterium]|nr:hypothetical protein [Acidobacteriota bacterium]
MMAVPANNREAAAKQSPGVAALFAANPGLWYEALQGFCGADTRLIHQTDHEKRGVNAGSC